MPDHIGRYKAQRVVGSGAFATVWLAEDETLAAPVAIKVLAENWAHDEEVRQRFLEEARILWRADSDRIVRIHNVDELEDGRPYFVMDFADRGTLQQRMQGRADEGKPWSIEESIELSLAIAEGLKVAHALGIVHRDLKPANIMFQSVPAHHGEMRDEKLILTDFGMAKSVARSRGTTIATGTPYYMAPEQAEGRADERSDIYAAGVVLYELLAGRVPYPYDSPGRLFQAQMSEPPGLITTLRPDVPPELEETLQRAISTDPSGRWPSADAWSDALSAAAEGKAPAAPVPLAGVDPDVIRTMGPAEIAAAKAEAAGAQAAGVEAAGPGEPAAPPPPPPAAPPPPPRPPAVPPTTGGTGDRGRGRKRWKMAVPIVAVAAAAAAIVSVIALTGASKADARDLTAEPVTSLTPNAFTPTLVPDPVHAGYQAVPTNPPLPQVISNQIGGPLTAEKAAQLINEITGGLNPKPGSPSTLRLPGFTIPTTPNGATQPIAGSTPGLYGGTQLLSVCDKLKLISFLTTNPQKAQAWADVLGISVVEIPVYIASLTDVVLQADTRVTNHGFVDGKANPIDSILQRGTAVLVDVFGVPRVRCYCGNPLTEPRSLASDAKIIGKKWPGLTLKKTVVITKKKKAPEFGTIDVLTGTTAVYKKPGTKPSEATLTPSVIEPVPGTTPETTPTETTPTETTPTETTPTETAPATTATPPPPPPPPAPPPPVGDITAQGSSSASSEYSGDYPVSLGVDGDVTTSWFSSGDKEGSNSTYTWVSKSGPVFIGRVKIVSNAANSVAVNREGFGFASVRVEVLKNGKVVASATGSQPGINDITMHLKAVGDTVRLLLYDHLRPECGGFGELVVYGYKPTSASSPATAASWSGTWTTSWGTMTLTQSAKTLAGTYTHDEGHVGGVIEGRVFVGTWSEAPSYKPPNDAGDIQLVLAEDGSSFTGRWRYGSKGAWTNDWTGTRTKSAAAAPSGSSDSSQAIAAVKAVLEKNRASCRMTWSSITATQTSSGWSVRVKAATSGNAGEPLWNVINGRATAADPLSAEIESGCP